MKNAGIAMTRIANARVPFVSRGDDSGTHKRELFLWHLAGLDATENDPGWYHEAGSGMGATLNTAAAMTAYTLVDSGTWLNFNNRQGLAALLRGDPVLFNNYGVILVDKKRHPHVKSEHGQRFIDWLISPIGQNVIGAFMINGERAFTPNALGG